MLFAQSEICGEMVTGSDKFLSVSKQLLGRKMYLSKVGKPLYLQLVNPFYTVDKTTFIQFCDQVMDNLVTLLLW